MIRRLVVLQALLWRPSAANSSLAEDIRAALVRSVERMSAKYGMSIAAAYYTPEVQLAVSAGFTDAGLQMGTPTRAAQPNDLYVWGSTTKMFTAPAVLQLVSRGIVSLDDPISKHIDPLLLQLNGTRLADKFGKVIDEVKVRHLMHMTSGIQDYDGNPYAQAQFQHRDKAFSPLEIIGNFVNSTFEFAPGTNQDYCSVNYILLGLILANYDARPPKNWNTYDQFSVIPEPLRKEFQHSVFVNAGTCQSKTPVHGFMEYYDTAGLPKQDVWNVSCVGGWTAGNYLGSVADVARYTYYLYNKKEPKIVSREMQAHLTNFTAPGSQGFKFYGMGTFSLDWSVGDAEAYGHVGDTYGYQSQTTYFPELDFVLTVATDVETASQAQPADFTCTAYHEVLAVLRGTTPPVCTFTVPDRFIGTCKCSAAPAEIII